jgi:hypothetical protein
MLIEGFRVTTDRIELSMRQDLRQAAIDRIIAADPDAAHDDAGLSQDVNDFLFEDSGPNMVSTAFLENALSGAAAAFFREKINDWVGNQYIVESTKEIRDPEAARKAWADASDGVKEADAKKSEWRAEHQSYYKDIKALVPATPVLQLLDWKTLKEMFANIDLDEAAASYSYASSFNKSLDPNAFVKWMTVTKRMVLPEHRSEQSEAFAAIEKRLGVDKASVEADVPMVVVRKTVLRRNLPKPAAAPEAVTQLTKLFVSRYFIR